MQRSVLLPLILLAACLQAAASGTDYPTNLFWGDTHVHTALSGDAFAGGARLAHDAAYRFARGEAVVTSSGQRAKLARPLDFIVIADHANNLGAAYYRAEYEANPDFRESQLGKRWLAARDRLALGHIDERALKDGALLPAHRSWQVSFRSKDFRRSVWDQVTQSADKHNTPDKFTAFIGYEWTPSEEEGSAQHRVVLFADDASYAGQILPFSSYDSSHEEDLWRFLDRYEKRTGGRVISIPHNSNLTSGRMFATTTSFGDPLTSDYALLRAHFEPIVEATQIKGDSETHPYLSPQDEFADFERWNGWGGWENGGLRRGIRLPKRPESQIPYEYVRSALQIGLQLEDTLGANPFKFGVIGSTDAHTGLASADDDNFWGKNLRGEPSADRVFDNSAVFNYQMNASGYAGVWAHENTRDSIFAAFRRKETYATTGPRMRVRAFAGYDFVEADLRNLPQVGYAKGVPMGGELTRSDNRAPVLVLLARKDPSGANLDRIQVIKGWIDAGQRREKVYNAVVSDDRQISATGQTTPVGNTVNLSDATYTNSIGDAELKGLWRDPDFVPGQAAVYYVRVLQIPTPRWTLYDKVRYQISDFPADIPLVSQERAYTSAFWYSPAAKPSKTAVQQVANPSEK